MRSKLTFCGTLAASLLCAGSLLAEPSAADRATARSLAGEGYQALQTKDYATAADRFSRADALVHAPTLMIDWARALVGLGKLVEAQERYEQIIREGVDSKAPKSWQRALTDATAELAAIKPRLGWITITITGSKEARVTLDGAPVPPAAVGVRRAVNPGQREVRVTAKGFLPQKMALDVAEGGAASADFTLEPDPDAQVEAPVSEAPTPPPAPPVKHNFTSTYVAFGVGGVGLLVGGVTGAIALGKRSELASACNAADQCRSNQKNVLSSYHTLGIVSGVGFGVGVVGVGAGVALWLLNRDSAAQPAHGLVIQPYVGVASVGAVGSF
ncbi:MAG: carboxypeptidase-like regulatory domain-containing protein [Pseudomonadota bacterium]